jgi:hypothetical protein
MDACLLVFAPEKNLRSRMQCSRLFPENKRKTVFADMDLRWYSHRAPIATPVTADFRRDFPMKNNAIITFIRIPAGHLKEQP